MYNSSIIIVAISLAKGYRYQKECRDMSELCAKQGTVNKVNELYYIFT